MELTEIHMPLPPELELMACVPTAKLETLLFIKSKEVNIFPVEISVMVIWTGKSHSLPYIISEDFGLTNSFDFLPHDACSSIH